MPLTKVDPEQREWVPAALRKGAGEAAQGEGLTDFPRLEAVEETFTALIVDDSDVNRHLLADHLELMGLASTCAENGAEALEKIRQEKPDVVLLDLMMPVLDGHAVLKVMKSDDALRAIPVIVISGKDDDESVIQCLEEGADDYLVKPFKPKILRARIGNSLAKVRLTRQETSMRKFAEEYTHELEQRVAAQVRQITAAHLSTIFALSTLAESRDPETGDHLDRMRIYCRMLALTLGQREPYNEVIDEEFADHLYAASPLHDIGKVGIPDNILLKPGKLTDEEFSVMETHCEIGAHTLREVASEFPDNEFAQMGIEIALCHHEKWDGSGYPRGLSGEDIPLPSRILALCDVYDALTSKRCYKEAFSHEKSRAIIEEGRGKHFEPVIVDAFLECEMQFNLIRRRLQPGDDPVA